MTKMLLCKHALYHRGVGDAEMNKIHKTHKHIKYIYMLLFIVVVLIWNIGHHVTDISPIIYIHGSKGYHSIKLESYEIQFVIYSSVCFVALALFSVMKKVYIAEIRLFYIIVTFYLWIYTIMGCIFLEIKVVLSGMIMLVVLRLINKELKDSYPKYSFVEILLKRNVLLVMFIDLILVAINIIYIIVPKDNYYEHSHRGEEYTYELIEDGIEEKFHFDIDLEYIMTFYPLNCFIIICCIGFMFLLLCYKLINKIEQKEVEG